MKAFEFSKELEELILVEPGYDMPVPICRYDVFTMDLGILSFVNLIQMALP